jgi:hypothetical protein
MQEGPRIQVDAGPFRQTDRLRWLMSSRLRLLSCRYPA